MHNLVAVLFASCVKAPVFYTGFVFNNEVVNKLPILYTYRTQKVLNLITTKIQQLTPLNNQISSFIHAYYNNYYIK